MESDTESNRHGDKQTLDSSFFDTMWPLILNENKCHLESESVDYFVPCTPFDQLHWHQLLSDVGFSNYKKPDVLHCCEAARQKELSDEEAKKAADETAMGFSAAALENYEKRGCQSLESIDRQVKQLREQQERRQKLAYDFANRKYPWTMQTPIHELGFVLTPELSASFKSPMERDILQGIYNFDCKFMLIDASSDVCVDDFQRWVKFRPYVQMLALVRCPRVERHLQLLNVFHTLLIEENALSTWHNELQSSLSAGLTEAKKLELFKNCAEAFVFVFSRYRGICTCDTFKILRYI